MLEYVMVLLRQKTQFHSGHLATKIVVTPSVRPCGHRIVVSGVLVGASLRGTATTPTRRDRPPPLCTSTRCGRRLHTSFSTTTHYCGAAGHRHCIVLRAAADKHILLGRGRPPPLRSTTLRGRPPTMSRGRLLRTTRMLAATTTMYYCAPSRPGLC